MLNHFITVTFYDYNPFDGHTYLKLYTTLGSWNCVKSILAKCKTPAGKRHQCRMAVHFYRGQEWRDYLTTIRRVS